MGLLLTALPAQATFCRRMMPGPLPVVWHLKWWTQSRLRQPACHAPLDPLQLEKPLEVTSRAGLAARGPAGLSKASAVSWLPCACSKRAQANQPQNGCTPLCQLCASPPSQCPRWSLRRRRRNPAQPVRDQWVPKFPRPFCGLRGRRILPGKDPGFRSCGNRRAPVHVVDVQYVVKTLALACLDSPSRMLLP